jgi:hypothetical protein
MMLLRESDTDTRSVCPPFMTLFHLILCNKVAVRIDIESHEDSVREES